MECKCGCNEEVTSKGKKPKQFYSDACRKKWNRAQVGLREPEQTDTINKRTEETDTNGQAKVSVPLALPGDPDYAGCCEQVDGQWRVKPGPKPEPLQLLTLSMLDTLPVGVTRPTGQPSARTQAMTGENLNRRLIGVKVWQQTPEYAEVVHRLLTGKTEGMNLPTWARA